VQPRDLREVHSVLSFGELHRYHQARIGRHRAADDVA
jgi:hypothetical protein